MKKTKLINLSIIFSVSIFSIIYLFFGNHEHGLYKTLIITSIIPIMFIPNLLNNLLKININYEIELIYLIFIFFGYFLGSILNFYGKITLYDKIIHGLSGIISSILALTILIKSNNYDKNSLWLKIIFIICITLTVAVSWEFFEFINDNIFNKDAQKVITTGVNDTMLDMLMALIGSIIFCIFYIFENKTRKNLIITKFINNIK